jgi:hypothetical protein
MSFEASRKHGPFDLRWPVLRPRASTRHLVVVPNDPVSAAVEAAADAGAARLLAAVDARLSEAEGGYTPERTKPEEAE